MTHGGKGNNPSQNIIVHYMHVSIDMYIEMSASTSHAMTRLAVSSARRQIVRARARETGLGEE